jgi:hypothetical protein
MKSYVTKVDTSNVFWGEKPVWILGRVWRALNGHTYQAMAIGDNRLWREIG